MVKENLRTLCDKFLELALGVSIDKRLWITEGEKRGATLSPDGKVEGLLQYFFFVDEKGVSTNQLLRAVLDSEEMPVHLVLIKAAYCTRLLQIDLV